MSASSYSKLFNSKLSNFPNFSYNESFSSVLFEELLFLLFENFEETITSFLSKLSLNLSFNTFLSVFLPSYSFI